MCNIVVLFGVSGSGKSTLGQYLELNGFKKVITHTTRKMREGERDGVDYHFVTKDEFDVLDKIESTEYAGNFYGLSKSSLDGASIEKPLYLIMDRVGVAELKKRFGDSVLAIEVTIPVEEIKKRLFSRGESEAVLAERLEQAKIEIIENHKISDFSIENLDLHKAKEELISCLGLESFDCLRFSIGESPGRFYLNADSVSEFNTYSRCLSDFTCVKSKDGLRYVLSKKGEFLDLSKLHCSIKAIDVDRDFYYLETYSNKGLEEKKLNANTNYSDVIIKEYFDNENKFVCAVVEIVKE